MRPSGNYDYSGLENRRSSNSGRVLGGLLLIVVGLVLLAAKLHTIFLPHWLFTWPVFLIVLGLFVGMRHSFRRPGWLVLVLVGTVFLLDDLMPGFSVRAYFWPILIIVMGLWMILRPRQGRYPRRFRRGAGAPPAARAENIFCGEDSTSTEDYIDCTTIFGGTKKNVISKNFKGGEVVSVFGGTELNMMQADIQHPVVIDTTQVFGGTSIIVPPHWEVKSEVTAILGGVDDKRPVMPHSYEPNKVLILKGTTLFGGLSIKSY